ncbi:hypothetical protein ACIOEX_32060 [Streptomyces sp. NPDC087850]|uniref:hypothetical protein n=1 Tax=Streptomyces sp. NPDC087850 TaxID=3365809 RepID=UPI0038008A45
MITLFHGDPITSEDLPDDGLGAPSFCAACLAAEMFRLVSPHGCDGITTLSSIGDALLEADPQPCPCPCSGKPTPKPTADLGIRADLAEADRLVRARAAPEELTEVAARMRAHIRTMLPIVAGLDDVPPDDPRQEIRRSRVRSIQPHIGADLVDSTLPAHKYVAILREECAWLLSEYITGATWGSAEDDPQ